MLAPSTTVYPFKPRLVTEAGEADAPIRARAFAEIVCAMGGIPDARAPLLTDRDGLWDTSTRGVDALVALEKAFGIDLDIDEVCGLRIPALLDLVALRVAAQQHSPAAKASRQSGRPYSPDTPATMVWSPDQGVCLFPDAVLNATSAAFRQTDGFSATPAPRRRPAGWRGRRAGAVARLSARSWIMLAWVAVWLTAIATALRALRAPL